jgi:hypothetical protein
MVQGWLPAALPGYFHPKGRSRGTRGISSCGRVSVERGDPEGNGGTYLTSRGVPFRFRRRTTAWGPPTSSKVRKAAEESTRMQRSVSSTIDVSAGVLRLGLRDLGSLRGAGICRDVRSSSKRV